MAKYNKRNENAAARMQKNAENEALTKLQHEALSALCRARHELHTNIEECAKDDPHYKRDVIKCNIALNDCGLPAMCFIPLDTTDYIDIDDLNAVEEVGFIEGSLPQNEDEKRKWLNDNYERIYTALEELNGKIEKYLQGIDDIFHTNYAPTGAQRLF